MFTGIIQEIGVVQKMTPSPLGGELWITSPNIWQKVKKKDSVAVQGVCLTVVKVIDKACIFTLSPETMRTTNLGKILPGSRVNLELPLSAGDPFGGHFVLGHTDGMGTVSNMSRAGNAWRLEVSVPDPVERYLVFKGSIAVDGVSLTIASVEGKNFSAVILPLTAESTTLQNTVKGDLVNLEGDIMAKYIFKHMESLSVGKPEKKAVNEEFLRKYGYLEGLKE